MLRFSPEVSRRFPGPALEGAIEGTEFREAQEESHFSDTDPGVGKMRCCVLLAELAEQFTVGGVLVLEAPMQGAHTHVKRLGNRFGGGDTTAEVTEQL